MFVQGAWKCLSRKLDSFLGTILIMKTFDKSIFLIEKFSMQFFWKAIEKVVNEA